MKSPFDINEVKLLPITKPWLDIRVWKIVSQIGERVFFACLEEKKKKN